MVFGYLRGAQGEEQETQMHRATWRAACVNRTFTEGTSGGR